MACRESEDLEIDVTSRERVERGERTPAGPGKCQCLQEDRSQAGEGIGRGDREAQQEGKRELTEDQPVSITQRKHREWLGRERVKGVHSSLKQGTSLLPSSHLCISRVFSQEAESRKRLAFFEIGLAVGAACSPGEEMTKHEELR